MALKKSQKQAVAVGAGLAALAAAAAGVYMMTGKNAKNRKKVTAWAKKMQNEVVDELSKVQKATKANYHKIVSSVAKNYEGLKNVDTAELALMAGELKSNWDAIQSELKNAATKVRKVIPAVKKTAAKKVAVKKAPAKKAVAKKSTKKK